MGCRQRLAEHRPSRCERTRAALEEVVDAHRLKLRDRLKAVRGKLNGGERARRTMAGDVRCLRCGHQRHGDHHSIE